VRGALLATGGAVLVATALLTGAARRLATAHGVLDVPNPRSSHSRATPRGGGVAIVLVNSIALLALSASGSVDHGLAAALLGGGLAVAAVGFVDDRATVPAGVRLAVHLLVAVWAVYWLGGLSSVRVGVHVTELGWSGSVLAVLGIAWVLNLFNFMDGIDGLAGSEALFIAAGGAVLAAGGGVALAAAVFACACAGFLVWNWAPARIFLGDVGSGYLGYVIAVLALAAARTSPALIWTWLILGGVFFVDATVTLARRVLRGEPVSEAHRTHAYQWLARRWGSHAKVTIACLALNLVWLLPCAVLATRRPDAAPLLVLCAFVPLVLLALVAGAGRRDSR
jgi:Fuc2NAc and GlcNAc transferase